MCSPFELDTANDTAWKDDESTCVSPEVSISCATQLESCKLTKGDSLFDHQEALAKWKKDPGWGRVSYPPNEWGYPNRHGEKINMETTQETWTSKTSRITPAWIILARYKNPTHSELSRLLLKLLVDSKLQRTRKRKMSPCANIRGKRGVTSHTCKSNG